jgi:hypothetical protein
MIRLLISLLVAGMIAGGIYYFLIYDDPQPAQLMDTTSPVENPADAIDAANDAVQQSQNLQDRIDQRGQEVEEGY